MKCLPSSFGATHFKKIYLSPLVVIVTHTCMSATSLHEHLNQGHLRSIVFGNITPRGSVCVWMTEFPIIFYVLSICKEELFISTIIVINLKG